ncbi:hypothetical protein FB45DRAFT_1060475 [Roridomyces roridus]|uniref:Uncharacterized protein n=1 Tax=Roridomyces roridus TaxID=1738132 RepID=A0AAD7BNU3_9AGAR|nr:hypothetical protein FB45DRAFT_1060475 [Roridomyces roridus]
MSNSSDCPPLPDSGHLVWAALTDPALSGASNPDIMGFAVRLSSFLANICAGKCGTEAEASDALRGMLVLSSAEMLCTYIAIAQHKLTRIDGAFTVLIIHSPVFWYYLLWKNIPKVLTIWRAWATREYHLMVDLDLFLSVLILASWMSLNVVVWVGGRAMYPDVFLLKMVEDSIAGSLIPSSIGLMPFSCFVMTASVAVYYARFFASWKRKPAKAKTLGHKLRLQFTVFKGISRTHRWLVWGVTSSSYWNWFNILGVGVIEPNFQWTYGQALALATTTPIIFPVIRLMFIAIRYIVRDPERFAKTQWFTFWEDVILLFLGTGKLAQRINNSCFHGLLDTSQPNYLLDPDAALPTTTPATPSTTNDAASDILLVRRASSRRSLRSSPPATPAASDASSPGFGPSDVDDPPQAGATTITGGLEGTTSPAVSARTRSSQQGRSGTWPSSRARDMLDWQ